MASVAMESRFSPSLFSSHPRQDFESFRTDLSSPTSLFSSGLGDSSWSTFFNSQDQLQSFNQAQNPKLQHQQHQQQQQHLFTHDLPLQQVYSQQQQPPQVYSQDLFTSIVQSPTSYNPNETWSRSLLSENGRRRSSPVSRSHTTSLPQQHRHQHHLQPQKPTQSFHQQHASKPVSSQLVSDSPRKLQDICIAPPGPKVKPKKVPQLYDGRRKTQPIPEPIRQSIIKAITEDHQSQREVAKRFRVSKTSVNRILKQGPTPVPTVRRPRRRHDKLTDEMKQYIRNEQKKHGGKLTAQKLTTKLKAQFGVRVCRNTVANSLAQMDKANGKITGKNSPPPAPTSSKQELSNKLLQSVPQVNFLEPEEQDQIDELEQFNLQVQQQEQEQQQDSQQQKQQQEDDDDDGEGVDQHQQEQSFVFDVDSSVGTGPFDSTTIELPGAGYEFGSLDRYGEDSLNNITCGDNTGDNINSNNSIMDIGGSCLPELSLDGAEDSINLNFAFSPLSVA